MRNDGHAIERCRSLVGQRKGVLSENCEGEDGKGGLLASGWELRYYLGLSPALLKRFASGRILSKKGEKIKKY